LKRTRQPSYINKEFRSTYKDLFEGVRYRRDGRRIKIRPMLNTRGAKEV
jgi:hypothetical protein